MINQFSRSELVLGNGSTDILSAKAVAVFGVGGVGGYAVDMLARAGIGRIDIIDNDTVSLTNLNRQIIATHSSIGMLKVEVAKNRILDINPKATVNAYNTFYLPENSNQFDFTKYDYIIDCIDTVAAKIELVRNADIAGTPIISSMGTGNKIELDKFVVTDIFSTTGCPLARAVRRELRKIGIDKLKVVFSTEEPIKIDPVAMEKCMQDEPETSKRVIPGSTPFVPPMAGIILSATVIKELLEENNE